MQNERQPVEDLPAIPVPHALYLSMHVFAQTLPEELKKQTLTVLSAYQQALSQVVAEASKLTAHRQEWDIKASQIEAEYRDAVALREQVEAQELASRFMHDLRRRPEEIHSRIRYRLGSAFTQKNTLGRYLARRLGVGPEPQIIKTASDQIAQARGRVEVFKGKYAEMTWQLTNRQQDLAQQAARARDRLYANTETVVAVDKEYAREYAYTFPDRIQDIAQAFGNAQATSERVVGDYLADFMRIIRDVLAHPQTPEPIIRRFSPWLSLDDTQDFTEKLAFLPPRSGDKWKEYIAYRFHGECCAHDPNAPKVISHPQAFALYSL